MGDEVCRNDDKGSKLICHLDAVQQNKKDSEEHTKEHNNKLRTVAFFVLCIPSLTEK
jgi:hypothetical protein